MTLPLFGRDDHLISAVLTPINQTSPGGADGRGGAEYAVFPLGWIMSPLGEGEQYPVLGCQLENSIWLS